MEEYFFQCFLDPSTQTRVFNYFIEPSNLNTGKTHIATVQEWNGAKVALVYIEPLGTNVPGNIRFAIRVAISTESNRLRDPHKWGNIQRLQNRVSHCYHPITTQGQKPPYLFISHHYFIPSD
jgi:hypothetical protein